MKKWLLIALLLVVGNLFGQNSIDLLTGSFRYGFQQKTVDQPGSATESVGLLNVKVPIVFSESTIWYNDLTYQASIVNYSDNFNSTLNPTRLHGFILQTGLVRQLTDHSAIQLLLAPRLMTDFNRVDARHFQFGGIGLYEKTYSERLTIRYGLMYNRELFGNMFVPLVNINWEIAPRWRVTGLLPVFGKIDYQVNGDLHVGLSHFGLITSYQVGDPTYSLDYIERKSIDLAVFVRQRLAGNVHVEGRFGYALGRSYTQYAKGDEMDFRLAILTFGDERIQKNVLFDPGLIIDFRLVYNLLVD